MEFYMLDSVSNEFLKEVKPNDFIRSQIMYVSKLRGGVMIKYDRVPSSFQGLVGDPAPITDEGVIPPRNEKGTNKIQQF